MKKSKLQLSAAIVVMCLNFPGAANASEASAAIDWSQVLITQNGQSSASQNAVITFNPHGIISLFGATAPDGSGSYHSYIDPNHIDSGFGWNAAGSSSINDYQAEAHATFGSSSAIVRQISSYGPLARVEFQSAGTYTFSVPYVLNINIDTSSTDIRAAQAEVSLTYGEGLSVSKEVYAGIIHTITPINGVTYDYGPRGDSGNCQLFTSSGCGFSNSLLFGDTSPIASSHVSGWLTFTTVADSGSEMVFQGFLRVSADARNVVTNVPEPSSWTMLLAGAGLIGLLRRRKSGDRVN